MKRYLPIILIALFIVNMALAQEGSRPAITPANAAQIQEIAALTDFNSWITDVEFSPDGSLIGTPIHYGPIALWDAESFEVVYTWNDPTWVDLEIFMTTLAFSPDGNQLAIGGIIPTVYILDIATSTVVVELPIDVEYGPQVTDVAFSPDGRWVAASSVKFSSTSEQSASVWLWDTETWTPTELITFEGQSAGLQLSFSPDSGYLAYGGTERLALTEFEPVGGVWDIEASQAVAENPTCTPKLFSPTGALLTICQREESYGLSLWDINETNAPLQQLDAEWALLAPLAFSPNGELLMVGYTFWDVATGEQVAAYDKPNPQNISAIAFNPAGTLIAYGVAGVSSVGLEDSQDAYVMGIVE